MNQTLIEKGEEYSLWGRFQPSGDGKRMEIWKKNIIGLNDLSASENIRPDMFSYACKIPCSEGKNNG